MVESPAFVRRTSSFSRRRVVGTNAAQIAIGMGANVTHARY